MEDRSRFFFELKGDEMKGKWKFSKFRLKDLADVLPVVAVLCEWAE